MTSKIGRHRFGESNIEFLAVNRRTPRHSVRRFNVKIDFVGNFQRVYTRGENTELLPSSAVNNTVLAFAQRHISDEPERYATALVDHFLAACPAAQVVEAHVAVSGFEPLRLSGGDSFTNFSPPGQERQSARARINREGNISISGGIRGMQLFKTTGSHFKGFRRDQYTTTPVLDDRALGMEIDVRWFTKRSGIDFASCRQRARQAVLDAFAVHVSHSSEHTCYVLGDAVLAACPEISRSIITGAHQTRRLADMSAFGYKNPGEIYMVDDAQATTVAAEAVRSTSHPGKACCGEG
ncbi:urate oxidase [Actinobacteria bacterium OV450]|nr:urate oxidase [Actinobacteria bacterium OV450]